MIHYLNVIVEFSLDKKIKSEEFLVALTGVETLQFAKRLACETIFRNYPTAINLIVRKFEKC